MSIRPRISSPLEAGPSLLDSHLLPSHLIEALEYTSDRLARKALHFTLVVVRHEYQLRPSVPVTPPAHSIAFTPTTPSSPHFASLPLSSPSRLTGPFKGLVRRGTDKSIASSSASSTTSEAPSIFSLSGPPSSDWPPTPASPPPATPATPMTPQTPSSMSSISSYYTSSYSGAAPVGFGIRLVYTSPVAPKDEKIFRATLAKAERKFELEPGSLPPATTGSAYGLNADLVRRSILQNEVLFSSEGLTLLGLDRLYTFKAALAAYGRSLTTGSLTQSQYLYHSREDNTPVEEALDALRRLVLANNGRQVSKSDLHRSFEWIGVNTQALSDVERMYRRAYGGPEKRGAFEVTAHELAREWELKKAFEEDQKEAGDVLSLGLVRGLIRGGDLDLGLDLAGPLEPQREKESASARPAAVVKIGTPPAAKPVLRLKTSLDKTELTRPRIRTAPLPVAAQLKKSVPRPIALPAAAEQKAPANNDVEELAIKLEGLSPSWDGDDDEDDGDLTARPTSVGARDTAFWAGSSIDEMLSNFHSLQGMRGEGQRETLLLRQQRQQAEHGAAAASEDREGPMTPNGYDDISPITRGEWGFLFNGDAWQGGKTAAVETC